MKYSYFLIVLIGISVLFSCKKKDTTTDNLQHGKISSNLFPMLFNIGSHWIYQDTISSAIDSIALTSVTRGIYNLPPGGPGAGSSGDEETFTDLFFSTHYNYSYHEIYIGSMISGGDYTSGYIYISNPHVGDSSGITKVVAVIDSLRISNHTFTQVVKIKLNYPTVQYLYWVNYVGIIRKELVVNNIITERWDLQRYSTLMYPY